MRLQLPAPNKHSKNLSLFLSICFLVTALMSAPALAISPYFKSFGSDVFSGGWFIKNGTCATDSSSKYQDNQYGSPANDYYGGILSYAKADASNNAAGGASSQYAALANGKVEANTANSYGFYSNGAAAALGASNVKSLTFSNTTAGTDWGGAFQGAVRQSHCIPDYYGSKSASATTQDPSITLNSLSSGIFKTTPAPVTNYNLVSGPRVISKSEKITIFVNGSVYIGANISYDPSADTGHIPKFVLIAKGSIYIGPAVNQLDGFYIAQPDDSCTPTADCGNIWTCHPNDQNPLLDNYLSTYPGCQSTLVINGAVAAKQLNLMRAKGDVSLASTSEDTLSGANASSNIAEIINYSPQMILGGPFFSPASSTSASLHVDSLLSLPPVF